MNIGSANDKELQVYFTGHRNNSLMRQRSLLVNLMRRRSWFSQSDVSAILVIQSGKSVYQ